jgi:hypothetical protein
LRLAGLRDHGFKTLDIVGYSWRKLWQNPTRLLLSGFAAAILVGAVLLQGVTALVR